jgi:hypothetical protein
VTAKQRVLVVDGLSETEEVLRAVLEPRGLAVDRVRGPGAEQSAAKRRPSLVVLHVDEEVQPNADWHDVPRILIGAAKLNGISESSAGEHHLEHPFQYGELIRTIERLLVQTAD